MDEPTDAGLQVERAGSVLLVRLPSGNLQDPEDVQRLGRELLLVLEREGRVNMVVSLAGVADFSTALLGRLVMLQKKAVAAGGRVVLCCAGGHLRQALEDAGLTRLFPLYATEQEAALSF